MIFARHYSRGFHRTLSQSSSPLECDDALVHQRINSIFFIRYSHLIFTCKRDRISFTFAKSLRINPIRGTCIFLSVSNYHICVYSCGVNLIVVKHHTNTIFRLDCTSMPCRRVQVETIDYGYKTHAFSADWNQCAPSDRIRLYAIADALLFSSLFDIRDAHKRRIRQQPCKTLAMAWCSSLQKNTQI